VSPFIERTIVSGRRGDEEEEGVLPRDECVFLGFGDIHYSTAATLAMQRCDHMFEVQKLR
jgi:hypothetical protein